MPKPTLNFPNQQFQGVTISMGVGALCPCSVLQPEDRYFKHRCWHLVVTTQGNLDVMPVSRSSHHSLALSHLVVPCIIFRGFPGGSDGKEPVHNVGDPGSIPGSGRSPGNGNPLQYSSLENFMDGGAW